MELSGEITALRKLWDRPAPLLQLPQKHGF